jgi:hypothetical protein
VPTIFEHAICEADVVSVAGRAPDPDSAGPKIIHLKEASGRIVAADSEPQTVATCVPNCDVSYSHILAVAPVQSRNDLIRRTLCLTGGR